MNPNPTPPPPDRASLVLRISHSFEEISLDENAWDQFATRLGAEVYQSYEWSRIWWNFHAGDRDLRLATLYQGDRLVGLLPFFIETLGAGPFRVRAAKQISSDYTMGTMLPLIEPEFLEESLAIVHRHFLEKEHCDCLRWGPICGEEIPRRMAAAIQTGASPEGWVLRRVPHGVESVLDLPGTFEEYLSSLSKNHRTNFRRTRNRLERETQYSVSVVEDPERAEGMFEEFHKLHTAQWERVGEPGHFGDWPGALEFHRTLARAESKRGRLLLILGRANGEIVSAQYGYGFGDRFSWLLPARRMEEEWRKYGLGRVGFVGMVETAIEKGYRKIHLGGAFWGYKSDLGGKEEPCESMVITGSGAKEARLKRLLALTKFYGLLYYKIWFKRIAPRLPWRRGPLWHSWIRWRL